MITILCCQPFWINFVTSYCKYNFDRNLRGDARNQFQLNRKVDHKIRLSHVKLQLYLGRFTGVIKPVNGSNLHLHDWEMLSFCRMRRFVKTLTHDVNGFPHNWPSFLVYNATKCESEIL